MLLRHAIGCAVLTASVLAVGPAAAQLPQLPKLGKFKGSGLTNEQFRDILWLRALQSSGSGGVHRGVPLFVPLGSPMFPGMQASGQQAAGNNADQRAASRAARVQRLRQARQEEVARREEAARRRAQAAAAGGADPQQAAGSP